MVKNLLLLPLFLSITITVFATKKMCFTPQASYTAGNGANAIVSADFDKDGKLDIAVSNRLDKSISVFIGNGDGTFRSTVNHSVQSIPAYMTCDDMNNDGNPDLVTANFTDSSITILTGNGTGGFNAAYHYKEAGNVSYLAIADFDKDGNKDLAICISQSSGSALVILSGSGGGTISSRKDYPGDDITEIAVGYIDNDTYPDIITTCMSCTAQISAFINNGAGVFQPSITYTFPAGKLPKSAVIRDFTADGTTDLAVSCYLEDSVYILRGNQTGNYTLAATYGVNANSNKIIVADFDNNGALDILTCGSSNASVSILMDNTTQFVAQYLTFPTNGSNVMDVVSADFDGDMRMDIATVNYQSDDVSVLLNRSISLSTSYQGNSLVASDFFGTFQWINCDSNKIVPGATGKIFTPATPGSYAVIVTSGHCSDTSSCNPAIVPGNVATPYMNKASVFPNPANEILHVKLEQPALVIYSLQDVTGKTIMQSTTQGSTDIDISSLQPGLYILQLSGADVQQQFKITKQ